LEKDCENRGDCLLSEEMDAGEFHETLMECFQKYIGKLKERAKEKVTFS